MLSDNTPIQVDGSRLVLRRRVASSARSPRFMDGSTAGYFACIRSRSTTCIKSYERDKLNAQISHDLATQSIMEAENFAQSATYLAETEGFELNAAKGTEGKCIGK